MIPGLYRYQDRWKWFLPASRSSLNPPGPPGKGKNLSFRTRKFTEKIRKNMLYSLLIPFWGDPPGWMDRKTARLLSSGQPYQYLNFPPPRPPPKTQNAKKHFLQTIVEFFLNKFSKKIKKFSRLFADERIHVEDDTSLPQKPQDLL